MESVLTTTYDEPLFDNNDEDYMNADVSNTVWSPMSEAAEETIGIGAANVYMHVCHEIQEIIEWRYSRLREQR